eukprot:6180610-Pleurochrysis_carterae.AAC.3
MQQNFDETALMLRKTQASMPPATHPSFQRLALRKILRRRMRPPAMYHIRVKELLAEPLSTVRL